MSRRLPPLSVRAKLVLGFGSVSALLVLTLVVSLVALDRQHAATQTLATRNALRVQAADDVAKASSDLATWEGANVLGRGDQAGDLNDAIAEFRSALATLSTRAANPEQVSLVTKIRTEFTAFLALDRLTRSSMRAGAQRRARELALGPVLLDYGNIAGDADTFAQVARQAEASQVTAADDIASRVRIVLLVLAAIGTALAATVAAIVSRSILGRTRRLLEAAEAVAQGDLTRSVPASGDELGRVAGAYNDMVASLGTLVREIHTVSEDLVETSEQMAAGSDDTRRAAGEIARAIDDMAVGSERQVVLVNETRGSVGSVVAAARSTSESASGTAGDAATAQRLAAEGVNAADDARTAMDSLTDSSAQLTAAMGRLTAKSERIGGIVETITGIAGQTNLLALNAAIEAARAGEQGRGFAVVAEEVRKLAADSQLAAQSISELVVEMQGETQQVAAVVEESSRRTESGTATVEAARARFLEIDEAVTRVAGSADEIAAAGAAIAEQAAGMQRQLDEVTESTQAASAAAQEMTASTQETSASTDTIAAAARSVSSTAADLRALVLRFRIADRDDAPA